MSGNVDLPNPQKNPSTTYDPQVLFGTIAVAGSISNTFDLSGWSLEVLQIIPGNGTVAGTTLGTVITLYAGANKDDTFCKVYGTTGAVASTFQFGSTGNQVITNITALQPLRYVQFAMGGTQSQAIGLNLIVK